MSRRFCLGLSAFVVVVAVTASSAFAQKDGASAAQDRARAAAAAKATYKVPKTSWGEPDLQGVWSYATTTPLQRPDAMAGKETLTDAEIEALAEAQAERQDSAPRTGDPGTYNNFWWDRGKSNGRTSLIIDPPDGKIPWKPEALVENAKRAAYRRDHPADSHLDRTPTDRCIMYHGVPPLPSGYNNTYQIVQSPTSIVILHEQFREMRVISIGTKPTGSVPQWFGTSYGHWEGDTLVVETDNFADRSSYNFANDWRQVRPSYKLVEKFTRKDGGMMYEFTVTDPTLFTSPWTAQTLMTKADGALFEYACHEGNYSMISMLGNKKGNK